MTAAVQAPVFALLVRSHPYQRRSARAELDIALAALAMDFRVEIYFIGSSVMQLVKDRDCDAASLPAGYRAWAALPDLGDAALFAEPGWLDRLAAAETPLAMPVEPLDPDRMSRRWRRSDHSMVI